MKRYKMLILLVLCSFIVSCSAEINVTTCEINVKQGNTDIPCETGYFDFGNIPLNFAQTITFTIENTGIGNLELNGDPLILITGTNNSEFQAFTNNTETELSSEENTTFKIRFVPDSMGLKTARVSIISNDKDENPYTFVIVGTCTAPAAEIHVRQDATDILSPTGNFDFGKYSVGASSDQFEFTIENNGNENLELTDTPDKIRISGTNASSFIIDENGIQSLIPGGNSTKFKIVFKPLTPGVNTAKISILNNDSDENPYIFTIIGTGEAVPEINVKQDTTDISNGTGKYIFTDTSIDESSSETTFTIESIGSATLHLTDNPDFVKITGTDAGMFSVNLSSTDENISPGNSTSFGITFNPTQEGLLTATVSIANNDDDENPYTFTIEGKSLGSEINVKQDSDDIENSTGQYDFVAVKPNQTTPDIEFTIENKGAGNLRLTGSPIIEISGTHASQFTLNSSSTTSFLAPGNSTTFKIKCTPTSKGLKTATVSIANNDADENPYTFTIRAFGIVYTEGDINGDGLADMVVGANLNDAGGTNAGRVYIFFGKSNWNSSYDASNADVKITGEDATDELGYSISMAGDVNNDGFEDLVVGAHFDETGGYRSGTVYIFFGRYNWKSSVDASEADVKLIGEDVEDQFGYNVTCGGDINDDGINDVIVGAIYDDDGGDSSGCAFIFFGRSQWNSQIDASNANVKIIGEQSSDIFGHGLAASGDVNNDGIFDIIIGSAWNAEGGSMAGGAYIFYGRTNWASSIDASLANVKLIGENQDDYFGADIVSGGDINNDSIDDIVVSSTGDDTGGSNAGSVYIFFGRSNWASKIDASNANSKLTGADANDRFGSCVNIGKDLNNDGIDDLLIGAYLDDDGGDRSGCAFIFYGRSVWSSSIDASLADIKFIGEDPLDFFGGTCLSYCDINNDGISDLVIGSYGDDDGATDAGAAYIFFGRNNWNSVIDASNANVKIKGEETNDRFGSFHYGN